MSNPTTPFGWQMPENTDLVTDLPADFEVFGQAVATSMQDLLGGTTGQLLSKASGTDMDFTWTSANPGDITGVTAGVGISGGGTSGDVTVTNSMATAFTTSGDLIQATGSGTFARLGTGTSGQYLTTNGTTNSWGTISSGGITLITETVASAVSSITYGSIPGTYKELLLVWDGLVASDTGTGFQIRINNDSGSNYYGKVFLGTPNVDVKEGSGASTTIGESSQSMLIGTSGTNLARLGAGSFRIYNYASSTKKKRYDYQAAFYYNQLGAMRGGITIGSYDSTTAVTSIDIFRSTGSGTLSNATDTSLRLYGIS